METADHQERAECAPLRLRIWAAIALALLALAVATRISTYGHPDLHVDETFYFAAAIEMLHGAVPYVDVWDRKPPGHFMLYAGIAAISDWYGSYQIAATFFAAATSLAIFAIGRRLAGQWPGLTGAALYLLVICQFQGHGGQSAVFYNLLIASAAALLVTAIDRFDFRLGHTRIAFAMILAGAAITIKTTAVFEAGFLGMFAAGMQLRRHGANVVSFARIAGWAALGLLPTAVFALWYALHGYWDEYWTAMVLSNLRKPVEENGAAMRLAILAAMLLPLIAASAIALTRMPPRYRVICAGWLVAATVGFFSVPAYYLHYALPLLVPLCAIAPACLAMPRTGAFLLGIAAVMPLLFYPFTDFSDTRHARAAMDRLVGAVEQSKGDGPLLVFDGPPLLYPLTGSRFPTPLAFPNHLHQASERNVSHIDTREEVERILALRPGVIVDRNSWATNTETAGVVRTYAMKHCRKVASEPLMKGWKVEVTVYGFCRD